MSLIIIHWRWEKFYKRNLISCWCHLGIVRISNIRITKIKRIFRERERERPRFFVKGRGLGWRAKGGGLRRGRGVWGVAHSRGSAGRSFSPVPLVPLPPIPRHHDIVRAHVQAPGSGPGPKPWATSAPRARPSPLRPPAPASTPTPPLRPKPPPCALPLATPPRPRARRAPKHATSPVAQKHQYYNDIVLSDFVWNVLWLSVMKKAKI